MLHLDLIRIWFTSFRTRVHDEVGSTTLETVIIAAALAAVAIAATALIVAKVMSHASSVK